MWEEQDAERQDGYHGAHRDDWTRSAGPRCQRQPPYPTPHTRGNSKISILFSAALSTASKAEAMPRPCCGERRDDTRLTVVDTAAPQRRPGAVAFRRRFVRSLFACYQRDGTAGNELPIELRERPEIYSGWVAGPMPPRRFGAGFEC